MMRSRTVHQRHSAVIVVLAAALGAAPVTLALPTDAPDSYVSRGADVLPMSAPEPIVIVQTPETQPPAPARALSPNPLWEIPLSKLSTTRERPRNAAGVGFYAMLIQCRRLPAGRLPRILFLPTARYSCGKTRRFAAT